MSVWMEVGIGIVIIMGGVWLVKTVMGWNLYRKSIYTEIYSNYFEYAFRAKKREKLSVSSYFRSRFGNHRIYYQIVQKKNEKYPQAYVVIILSSGLYIMNIKNQQNQSRNPMEECKAFTKKICDKIGADSLRIVQMVVYPENSKGGEGKPDKQILVIRRKQMFETLKMDFERNAKAMSDEQIEQLYQAISRESDRSA